MLFESLQEIVHNKKATEEEIRIGLPFSKALENKLLCINIKTKRQWKKYWCLKGPWASGAWHVSRLYFWTL